MVGGGVEVVHADNKRLVKLNESLAKKNGRFTGELMLRKAAQSKVKHLVSENAVLRRENDSLMGWAKSMLEKGGETGSLQHFNNIPSVMNQEWEEPHQSVRTRSQTSGGILSSLDILRSSDDTLKRPSDGDDDAPPSKKAKADTTSTLTEGTEQVPKTGRMVTCSQCYVHNFTCDHATPCTSCRERDVGYIVFYATLYIHYYLYTSPYAPTLKVNKMLALHI
ncbi:hypothetical protein CC80DRAFT_539481 [Byssothecium circinans]|uniref:Uncharacterized protein n=1 Tax=Byssothecium circinans TaxID=147558 RepID=A0A6A5TEU2_9PLEO|nr:hypothetical protein CC80DRAFT_539481 [Byssothecium circinans]